MHVNRMHRTWLASAALVATCAQAQVSFKGLDRDMAGPRSQVLVLGTVHLSELPEGFDPTSLQGVLDRLAAFKPDVITIEAMSGEECDLMKRHPSRYSSDYCPSTEVAQKSTGMDVPTAIAEVHRLLQAWPAAPTPAQRRQLAAAMLAANDRASAYAQWLQLPAAERQPGDGLDAPLVELLRQIATRRNENYLLGSQLAARLGLVRVHAVDNHTGDNLRPADEAAFGKALTAAWAAGPGELKVHEQRTSVLKASNDLMPLYRYSNDPAYLQALTSINIAVTLRAKSPEGYTQAWVAGWETRNLRMVANIREAFRDTPGARVLSIVGASHKPWFDAWLAQMQGVDVIDAARWLQR